tara:strand:- start:201 stop:704 length:504 start_codon:yes stop_codon:yes gene_type:complete
MDKLKKYIRHLIKEAEYDVPNEILDTLKDKLQMNPIERFVSHFKAVNSIPPSYRVFLHNEQSFDIIYESFSLMAKIDGREYYIADMRERAEAIEKINRLLTVNQMIMNKPGEEKDDTGAMAGLPKPMGKPPKGGTRKPASGTPPPTPETPPPPPPGGGDTDEPEDEA